MAAICFALVLAATFASALAGVETRSTLCPHLVPDSSDAAQRDLQIRSALTDSLKRQLAKASQRFGLHAHLNSNTSSNVSYRTAEIEEILKIAAHRPQRAPKRNDSQSEQAHAYIPLMRVACTPDIASSQCFSADLRGVKYNRKQAATLALHLRGGNSEQERRLTVTVTVKQPQMTAACSNSSNAKCGLIGEVRWSGADDNWNSLGVSKRLLRTWHDRQVLIALTCTACGASWTKASSQNESESTQVQGYLEITLAKNDAARKKRQAHDDALCSLKSVDIDLGAIIGKPVWPNPFQFTYCSGYCSSIIDDESLSVESGIKRHAAAARAGHFSTCCVPKSYTNIVVTQILSSNSFATIELDKAAAAECGCL